MDGAGGKSRLCLTTVQRRAAVKDCGAHKRVTHRFSLVFGQFPRKAGSAIGGNGRGPVTGSHSAVRGA